MGRKAYPSDLTDAQWALVEPGIPPARPGGRPRKTDMREVLDALFHLAREGCSWRALPHDFPPWRTVYNSFEAWRDDGAWGRILEVPRYRARKAAGRAATPRIGCVDRPSIKTAGGGREVGTDGRKRVRGLRRPPRSTTSTAWRARRS